MSCNMLVDGWETPVQFEFVLQLFLFNHHDMLWFSLKFLLTLLSNVFLSIPASLIMKGPEKEIVAGDMVTLECYDSNSTANMSQVHFERSSKVSHHNHTVCDDEFKPVGVVH